MTTSTSPTACRCGSGKPAGQCCLPVTHYAGPASAEQIPETLRLAWIHHEAGRFAEAEALYRTILAATPDHTETIRSLGVLAHSQGQWDTAAELLGQAIAYDPEFVICHVNLADTYKMRGDKELAVEHYRRALALDPRYIPAYKRLAGLLMGNGDHEEAVEIYERLTALIPDDIDAKLGLGVAYAGRSEFDKAVECYEQAIELDPQSANAHNNLANVLLKQGKSEDALAHCQRALSMKPDLYAALVSRGNILAALKRRDEAMASLRKAISIAPDQAEAYGNLAMLLGQAGRHEEAADCLFQAIAARPNYFSAFDTLLFVQHYDEKLTVMQNKAMAQCYGETVMAGCTPFLHAAPPASDRERRPLRVGFVSGDLVTHPVGIFTENALSHIDRTKIELIVYSTTNIEDDTTRRIREHVSEWRSLINTTPKRSAETIRQDRIDILVDLSGHTAKSGLPLFAWKPAPIQASWIGFFATTGVPTMDYFIGDRYTLPEGEEHHLVEKPWRLPDGYLCFTPPPAEAVVEALPMLANGYVTFGCFNKLSKMNDRVVALWSRLLHEVPGARLMLKSGELNEDAAKEQTLARFAAHGIEPGRLILEGSSSRVEYFAQYNKIDIALDPFPYNGGTTTVETLWMGVPVVVKHGDRFVAHMGEGILNHAGHPEWIGVDEDDYIRIAASLATSPDHLSQVRRTLREQMLASPLCDGPRFARQLENAFEQMWRIHCDEAPADPHTGIAAKLEAGTAHQQADEFDEAERLYRDILRLQPNHPQANHNLGVLAIQRGQPAASLGPFKTALQAEPKEEERWAIYIEALIAAGKAGAAERAFKQARRLGFALKGIVIDPGASATARLPRDLAALFEQFSSTLEALDKGGMHDGALQVAKLMIQTFPDQGEGYKALGVALVNLHRFEEAFAPLSRAAALLDNDPDLHKVLGRVAALHQARHLAAGLRQRGDLDGAERIRLQLQAAGWHDHGLVPLTPTTSPAV